MAAINVPLAVWLLGSCSMTEPAACMLSCPSTSAEAISGCRCIAACALSGHVLGVWMPEQCQSWYRVAVTIHTEQGL